MPTYEQWNDALIDYLTSGVPRGASIFLDINDDVLEHIGRRTFTSLGTGSMNWVDDFKRAVHAKCVDGFRVHLAKLQKAYVANSRPQGVAFLGAMVLAAYYMGEDGEVSGSNYFKRLREILRLGGGEGRPDGMEQAGIEEYLWTEWNVWLQKQGFLPTTQKGIRAKTYINYPISQSLLRRADKDSLNRLFEERHWPTRLDQHIVAARIRRELPYLSKHIQTLLQEGTTQRYQAISEAIFEVYEDWVAFGRSMTRGRDTVKHSKQRNLFAELYRVADLGYIAYYLYPRQPRRHLITHLQVKHNGDLEDLVEDRPGWYAPLWTISREELEKGAQYKLTGDSDFQQLILPARDFWILAPDPDNPESGVYISGGILNLGTPFILLCKRDLQSQITHLKNERLIEWSGDPYPLSLNPDWVEYRSMMVLSEAWSGIFIKNQDLYESLRPLSSLSISFDGGLRAPYASAWLDGYGPQITVIAFNNKVHLCIKEVTTSQILFDEEVFRDKPIQVKWSGAGDYIVEALAGTQSMERLVKILSWDQLPLSSFEIRESLKIGSWRIMGTIVESMEEVR